MADATTAARARIDRALAALERKVNDLKARPATARPVEDDDLFAVPSSSSSAGDPALRRRILELETAGCDASEALAGAIEQLRGLIQTPAHPIADHEKED